MNRRWVCPEPARCGSAAAAAAAALLGCLLLCAALPAAAEDPPRLPVVSLRYEHGDGYRQMAPDPESEAEDETEMEAYSQRHKLTVRLKEQWSRTLTTNLYTVVAWKDSEEPSESYAYLSLNPDLAWQITPGLKWNLSLRSKLTWLEPELAPDPTLDLLALLAKTGATWRLHERVKLIPSAQGCFDLYQDPADFVNNAQTWTAGLSLESELSDAVDLTGRYRGSFRFPLGPESTVERLFNNEFTLALTWDPNR